MGQPGSAATDRRKAACRRQPGPLRAATKESVTTAKDMLGEAGLYFDELNKLAGVGPRGYPADQSAQVQGLYGPNWSISGKTLGGLIELVDQLTKEAEHEKMKAIRWCSERAQCIAKHREARRQQLRALTAQREMQLERCWAEEGALSEGGAEQNECSDQFIFQK